MHSVTEPLRSCENEIVGVFGISQHQYLCFMGRYRCQIFDITAVGSENIDSRDVSEEYRSVLYRNDIDIEEKGYYPTRCRIDRKSAFRLPKKSRFTFSASQRLKKLGCSLVALSLLSRISLFKQ